MKQLATFFLATVLLLAGCVYDSPLTTEHKTPIDPSVLGLWEEIPDKEKPGQTKERMLVMRFSDTEYFIHYPIGENAIYWRAYAIEVGGISCVQLQALGTEKGPVPPDEKQLFNATTYQIENGELTVNTLNTKLIDKSIKGNEALRRAFLEHKGDKDLFVNPGRFRRVLEKD